MSFAIRVWALLLVVSVGGEPLAANDLGKVAIPSSFDRAKAGEERDVAGIKLCFCPPGKFTMGSPRSEGERRPGENQVEVTLTKGFWMGKYEATQGEWKRVMGYCRAS